MNVNQTQTKVLTLAGIVALGSLILGVIGGLQPVLDVALGGGTLLATQTRAEEQTLPPGGPATAQDSASKGDPAQQSGETQTDLFQNDPLVTLALSLQQKQVDLDQREKKTQAAEASLKVLRTELETRLSQLEEMRKSLNAEMETFRAQVEAKRNKEAKKWVGIYQAMQPQAAAMVIETMMEDDPSFAIELLSQMEPKRASKILDAMKKDKSIKLVQSGLHIGQK